MEDIKYVPIYKGKFADHLEKEIAKMKAEEYSKQVKCKRKLEVIKNTCIVSSILLLSGITGQIDLQTELKANATETSTVCRVYGVTMDNGNTLYVEEPDGNIHSWYVEDASEMDDYSPVELVYDTMGTETPDDDEVITVIPVNGNEITNNVADFIRREIKCVILIVR